MREYDVIVVGGGPSGSTAANLIAQRGFSVLVIEREIFPRFHIGESLLPCDLEVFRRLGVDPRAEHFLYKAGAEFIDERIDRRRTYTFSEALEGTADHAYQVDRAHFDHWLLSRAEEVGATVHYGERVTQIDPGANAAEKVTVTTNKDIYRARYVIDATGQDAFFARGRKTHTPLTQFGHGATFTHYENLRPEVDLDYCKTNCGNIRVIFVDDGWCWAIPLGGGRISIGLVSRKHGLDGTWLDKTIAASKVLSWTTDGATRVRKPGMLVSFSFHNALQHGARYACTGDAACFLDPVFSSGVSLGMVGASHLADELIPALERGTEHEAGLMDSHAKHMSHAYSVFATLVNSFYHSDLLHGLFFSEEQDMELRRGLTSVLAGDVFRTDNRFQNILMNSARRRIELAPRVHGADSPALP